jgi:hypothetical protein
MGASADVGSQVTQTDDAQRPDPGRLGGELPFSPGETGGMPAEEPTVPPGGASIETDSPEGYMPV